MFVAFSIPPFFATILATSFSHGANGILGLCYAAPATAAIMTYRWRAMLPHFLGARNALIASHLGISASLMVTGFAGTPTQFLTGLVLQGIVAPTFATSSSYLACHAQGIGLVNGIGSLQVVTRIASASGPAMLGVAIVAMASPLLIYRLLAILTLCSALLLIFMLPNGESDTGTTKNFTPIKTVPPQIIRLPYLSQMLLLFSISATAPNFIPYMQTYFSGMPIQLLGTIFAIPSFAYLSFAPFARQFKQLDARNVLIISFAALACSLLGQWLAQSWPTVAYCRIAMGIALFMALGSINIFLVRLIEAGNASNVFSRFELSGRSAMAAGALLGDMAALYGNLRIPFLMSAIVMALSSLWISLAYSRH